MTPLSGLGSVQIPAQRGNSAESKHLDRVVHNLHRLLGVRLALAVTVSTSPACVVPPPLSLEQADARANAAPAVVGVRGDDATDHPPGDVLTLFANQGTLSITAYDSDLEDTLFVRVFVDYTTLVPTAPRTECQVAPATPRLPERTATCEATTLCVEGGDHELDIDVYDREPVTVGADPPYRTTTGLTGSRHLTLQCLQGPPS